MINPNDIIVTSFSKKKKSGWSMEEDTGVRIHHKPTGLESSCSKYDSLHRNRAKCLESLEKVLGTHRDNPVLNPPNDMIRVFNNEFKRLYLGEWIPQDTSPTNGEEP